MVLDVVKYGHPVLRQKGAAIQTITPEIQTLIENMLDTMYDEDGVGLAAQQVGRALQLTVIDVADVTDRPSTMEVDGQPVDVKDYMPMILLNPVVTPIGAPVAGPEGCLSFPELYAPVTRPESVEVSALDEQGNRVQFRCGGLLARAVQHETDHLNGILFIDRMAREDKDSMKPDLEKLQAATKKELKKN